MIYSARIPEVENSILSDILKITEDPSVISFAGGLPASESFPVDAIAKACERVLSDNAAAALQYSATMGVAPLREWIAAYRSTPARTLHPDEVMIVSGSQQALDLLGKLFLDPGDGVIVERPTYLGAIEALALYQPNFYTVDSDVEGARPDLLTVDVLQKSKLMYLQPNFQNPTGLVMSAKRREEIASFMATQDNLYLVEDDPYGELWFHEAPPANISSLSERSILLGTFSKVLSPGLRLGYIIADKKIIRALEQVKQAVDLHTSTFGQLVALETLKSLSLQTHLGEVREFYRGRAQAMEESLRQYMGPNVRWNSPQGGMFIWLTLPEGRDTYAVLQKALDAKVAYVPGLLFYTDTPEQHTLRLSFVTVGEEKIRTGIQALAQIFTD
jgi:2-aminoadipate transaminase